MYAMRALRQVIKMYILYLLAEVIQHFGCKESILSISCWIVARFHQLLHINQDLQQEHVADFKKLVEMHCQLD